MRIVITTNLFLALPLLLSTCGSWCTAAAESGKSKSICSSSKKKKANDGGCNVFDLLEERKDEFSTFLEAAELLEASGDLWSFGNTGGSNSIINADRNFTAFVPTNAAFDAVGEVINKYFDFDIWTDVFLDVIFQLHVVPDSIILSTDLVDGQTVVEERVPIQANIAVSLTTDPPTLDSPMIVEPANIIEFDNVGSNGVFHVIDQVLFPAFQLFDVYKTGRAVPDFSKFVELIDLAGLATLLQGDGPFTVFTVPNQIIDSFGVAFFENLKKEPDLVTIMQNHIIQGQIMTGGFGSSPGAAGGIYTSLANKELVVSNVNVDDGAYLIDGVQYLKLLLTGNAAVAVIANFLFPPGLPTFLV